MAGAVPNRAALFVLLLTECILTLMALAAIVAG
jgi:hypothetical protein